MNLIATRLVLYSLLLHVLAFGLLFVSLDFAPAPIQPVGGVTEIIDAVAVDTEQVEQEITRLREAEQQRQDEQARQQQELESKRNEIERQTREAEQRRQQEEIRLAELKKQQQEEEQRRREEEQKLADTKKKQEELQKQQAELEAKKKQEEERRRQEEIAKAEAEKKRQEEEALKKKQAEEAARVAAAAAEQDKRDQSIISQYGARIQAAITREFNLTGLPSGLSCRLQIRMIPGGDVVDVRVVQSSGNALFDSRAEIAVKRASPLPAPEDPRVFARMREFTITFAPN